MLIQFTEAYHVYQLGDCLRVKACNKCSGCVGLDIERVHIPSFVFKIIEPEMTREQLISQSQAKAWGEVYDLCRELGMPLGLGSTDGLTDVKEFIKDLAKIRDIYQAAEWIKRWNIGDRFKFDGSIYRIETMSVDCFTAWDGARAKSVLFPIKVLGESERVDSIRPFTQDDALRHLGEGVIYQGKAHHWGLGKDCIKVIREGSCLTLTFAEALKHLAFLNGKPFGVKKDFNETR